MSGNQPTQGCRVMAVCSVLPALVASIALAVAPAPASASSHTVRTIDVVENVSVHLVRKSGSTLHHRGTATGTLPGSVRARFKITATKVTGSVTIYPRGGSLTMHIKGHPRSTSVPMQFGGSISIVRGTGRYEGAHGSGNFEGVVNLRNWDASVRATGRLTY
jgi:hypothetical protein